VPRFSQLNAKLAANRRILAFKCQTTVASSVRLRNTVHAELKRLANQEPLALVIVDTLAAFFDGDDINDPETRLEAR
jgi:hypothetical protein